jgi:transposase
LSVDALGLPLRFRLTGGERHDITQAAALAANYNFEMLLADTSYDSADFIKSIKEQGAEAVIPPRRNRTEQREIDRHTYKERHLVECFIGKVKYYRRIFSRFDKLANRYMSFLSFVAALIWLR